MECICICMTESSYFAWKHKHTNTILQMNFGGDYLISLFETEEKAFKAFIKYIGKQNICESIQDEYVLSTVMISDKKPMDISDCMNCPWGIMKYDRDNHYICDECGHIEFHN